MISVKNIYLRYFIITVAFLITIATIGYSSEHIIPNSELIREFSWTYGCTPTAAAMVLSYWDNYVPGIGKWVGYGKLIKHYEVARCFGYVPDTLLALKRKMETDYDIDACSGSGWTWPYNIAEGIRAVTNDLNGYNFSVGTWCMELWPEIFSDWCWPEIKEFINSNMPFVWSQGGFEGGHSVCAFGYTDDKYVIVYTTWGLGRQSWYYTDYCGNPEASIEAVQVDGVIPDGGSDSDIVLDDPFGGETLIKGGNYRIHWYQWGSQIARVSIDIAVYDPNGEFEWINVDNVASPGPGWKSYDWQIPNVTIYPGGYLDDKVPTSLRLYAYDSAGRLIAADGNRSRFFIREACSDLVVESITTNPVTPMVNQDVDVTITVKNLGSCPATPQPSFTYNIIEFYKNRDSAPSPSDWGDIADGFGEVPPGGTVTLCGKINYSYDGIFKMWAQVDSEQNVPETDENNNVFGPIEITVLPDDMPPTGGIAINGGAVWTNSYSVTLNLTCTDNVSCYQMNFYQEDPGGGGTSWTPLEPFATTKAWTLTSSAFPVYVRLYDKANNMSQYKDTILVDTVLPTGSIVINDGASRTTTESVILTLSCTDHASWPGAMRLSDDNMTWSQWEVLTDEGPTITISREWTLTGGEGTKSVYVQYRDNAENISEIYSDTIELLFNQPPVANAGPDQVIEGTGSTTSFNLIGTSSSDPDGDTITFIWTDPDGNVVGSEPIVSLSRALGTYTYTLTVTDPFEMSSSDTISIIIQDTTPPALTAPPDLTVDQSDPYGTIVNLGQPTLSDICDPSPVVVNNAPALFALGETVVTWTATDASGNMATAQQIVLVVPGSPANQLTNLTKLVQYSIASGLIDPELETSLQAKIAAALAALARENPNDAKVAMNDLKALINQVEAQTDKKITPAIAAEIIAWANRIIIALGG